jgi:hypothetical protein
MYSSHGCSSHSKPGIYRLSCHAKPGIYYTAGMPSYEFSIATMPSQELIRKYNDSHAKPGNQQYSSHAKPGYIYLQQLCHASNLAIQMYSVLSQNLAVQSHAKSGF